MRHLSFVIATSLSLSALAAPAPAGADLARERVLAAAAAMGGAERLRALRTVRVEGIGHRFALEQSDRPAGPFLAQYEQIAELRDARAGRFRQEYQSRGVFNESWAPFTLVVADGVAAVEQGGKLAAGTPSQLDDAELRLALAPERVVTAALDARDLAADDDADIQGARHHVVTWRWKGAPVRLYLSASSGLPSAVEVVRPFVFNTYFGPWGDVRTRVTYTNWQLEPGGLRYPHQWDDERNGLPYRAFVVTKLDLAPEVPAGAFTIPEGVKTAFQAGAKNTTEMIPLGRPDRKPEEIAPGVYFVPGWWNVTFVRQPDGIVIIEGPISSGYSAKAIAEAQGRFPSLPVKAVVSTADSWPHIGGLREYVARGIPVYVLDLNRPVVERLIKAPHAMSPDALARSPRDPKLEVVSQKTVLGSGANRVELYPVRGQGGERMVMAYLPDHRLLYGADLVQGSAARGFFSPQYLAELAGAVGRERLAVDRVFAMHAAPMPWSDVTAAVAKAVK
jgi:hypothetical protein